jgi:hypothetical protein
VECGRYNFCPEEFIGWVKIPTKQQKEENKNIAHFMEEKRVGVERATLLE